MKRDRIYRVEMERRYKGDSHWETVTVDVLANGNIQKVIAAAAKEAVESGFIPADDEGPEQRIAEVRTDSVNVIATADIEG
jgi:formaldehyde-activating enzyme involved in methanogenesis